MSETTPPRDRYVPSTLDGWTLDAITALLEAGVMEDPRFDWKERLSDQNGTDRLVASSVAMANKEGGFLVFGVADRGEQRLVGLELDNEFGNKFDNIARRSDPPVPYAVRNPAIALPGGRCVQVVQIRGNRRPHSFNGIFYVRTGGGTDGRLTTAQVRGMFELAAVQEAIGLAEIARVAFRLNRRKDWQQTLADLELLAPYASEGTARQQLHVLKALDRLATSVRANMPDDVLSAMFDLVHEALPGLRGEDVEMWRRSVEASIVVVGHIGYDVTLKLQRGKAVVEVAGLLSYLLALAREFEESELEALTLERFEQCEDAARRVEPEPFADAATWFRYRRAVPSLAEIAPPPELDEVEARLLGVHD